MNAKLARRLGFWDIFCVGAGAMISSGLFILPGQAFKISGPAMVLAYALAALMVVPAMLSKAEGSTQLQPGLAIPHVIIDDQELFEVMLVRCKSGIFFGADEPPVTTVFILVGSADERNYHLRALMAVATIVQEQDFTKRWLAARGPEELRDIVLLSGRQRDATPAASSPQDT